MPIIHDEEGPTVNYSKVKNDLITDARITSGARLTAIYLLSRPAAWDIVASNVAAVMKVGRNKAYAMLAELADFGYIRKVREAGEGESMGRVVYEAYQTPFAWMPEEDRPSGPEAEEAPLCASGYRAPRYRDPENGDTENRAQVITDLKKGLRLRKDGDGAGEPDPAPTPSAEQAEQADQPEAKAEAPKAVKAPKAAKAAKAKDVKARVSAEMLMAKGVSEQHAAEWLGIRKDKSLTFTPTALGYIEAEAAKAGITLAQVALICCTKGWGAFRASWPDWQDIVQPPPDAAVVPAAAGHPVRRDAARPVYFSAMTEEQRAAHLAEGIALIRKRAAAKAGATRPTLADCIDVEAKEI